MSIRTIRQGDLWQYGQANITLQNKQRTVLIFTMTIVLQLKFV